MIWVIIAALIIALDQWSKYFISSTFDLYQSVPWINGVFHITYIKNSGAAFGMMQNMRWILVSITFIIIIAAILYVVKNKIRDKLFLLAVTFILSGAIGNLIDRIRFGEVVDFFDFKLINFAIFNVADSFVFLGAVALGIYLLRHKGEVNEKN